MKYSDVFKSWEKKHLLLPFISPTSSKWRTCVCNEGISLCVMEVKRCQLLAEVQNPTAVPLC